MKHLLLLLLGCMPVFASAQTLTETQKQDALQCAAKFCNLLSRFSNGERTLTTQINALCSGADCSAYDDIKANKEVTLRNYLMAIQQKYPSRLQMNLSQPSLDNCEIFQDYDFSVGTVGFETMPGLDNQYVMAELPSVEHNNLLNVVFIFYIKQEYMGKSLDRKLIYSSKSGKITAFVCNNSPIISYSKGLDAIALRQYKMAVSFFEEAIRNGGDKFSGKKDCYLGAYVASIFSFDLNQALEYANQYGDIGYILNTKGQIALQKGQMEVAYNCYKQLETELMKGTKSFYPLSGVYYMLGILHLMPNSTLAHHDSGKSAYYLKKCISANGECAMAAAYILYIAWIGYQQDSSGGISDNDVSYTEALSYLKMAANKGYPPAFLPLAIAEQYDVKNKREAVVWYEKAANTGNAMAMALLGRMLVNESEFADRRNEGIKWLRKSLEGDVLDKAIDEFGRNVGRDIWPYSRENVQQLLRQVSNSSGNTGGISSGNIVHDSNSAINTNAVGHVQSSAQSHTSSNNYGHSNSNVNSISHSSHSYRRRRSSFNCPDDDYHIAGFSVGYVQKQWVYKAGDVTEKFGYWDDSKQVGGVQAGVRIEPLFKYGFGLNTGLYYEYYYSKSKPMNYEGEEYEPSFEEHALYLPVHLEYRLNFSKNFQLFFYGGVGLDYGLSAKIKTNNDNLEYDDDNAYKNSDWKRFNTSLEYGGGVRLYRVQLNFTMANGLINMSDDSEYSTKQNKNLMCSLSVMF